MRVWGEYQGTRTRIHTRSILRVITHTPARIQNADFYPTYCGYPLSMSKLPSILVSKDL
jgi:hypothetical protein